jgi:hypothetical protein
MRNIDRIWDVATLDEIISFDLEGNYDRVMALIGYVVGLNETYNQYEKKIKDISLHNNLSSSELDFIVNNKRLFMGSASVMETRQVLSDSNIDFNKFFK